MRQLWHNIAGKDVLLVPEDDGDAFMLLDEPAMQQAWGLDQAVGAWALAAAGGHASRPHPAP